jgi:hypothetical protein
VSQDAYPGLWPSEMSEESKQFWRSWAWITLFAIAAGLVLFVLAILRQM